MVNLMTNLSHLCKEHSEKPYQHLKSQQYREEDLQQLKQLLRTDQPLAHPVLNQVHQPKVPARRWNIQVRYSQSQNYKQNMVQQNLQLLYCPQAMIEHHRWPQTARPEALSASRAASSAHSDPHLRLLPPSRRTKPPKLAQRRKLIRRRRAKRSLRRQGSPRARLWLAAISARCSREATTLETMPTTISQKKRQHLLHLVTERETPLKLRRSRLQDTVPVAVPLTATATASRGKRKQRRRHL